ncbi:hypothetical protein Efla_005552 [Eimeria flavescens]
MEQPEQQPALQSSDLVRMFAAPLLAGNPEAFGPFGFVYPPPKPKYEPTLDPSVNLLMNTQLCARFVARGHCNKKNCTFAHSQVRLLLRLPLTLLAALLNGPVGSTDAAASQQHFACPLLLFQCFSVCHWLAFQAELRPLPDLRKTKWCRLVFHSLTCNVPDCPYAHSASELKSNAQELVSYKTTFCKYYQRGTCLSGPDCRFAHSPSELRNPTDHPRCAEVREQLRARNREAQRRRQIGKKAAAMQREVDREVSAEEPERPFNPTSPHVPPPGLPPRPGALIMATNNNAMTVQVVRQPAPGDLVKPLPTLRPFVHRRRASLDANLAAAYAHARRRSKIEKMQRQRDADELAQRLSRISTTDCLHLTQEEVLSLSSALTQNAASS